MSIFGDSTIQASLVEKAENRQTYRLVGLHHELVHWPTPHKLSPPGDDVFEREYDPAELHDTERWIVHVSATAEIEALRISFLMAENGALQISLNTYPATADEFCINTVHFYPTLLFQHLL